MSETSGPDAPLPEGPGSWQEARAAERAAQPSGLRTFAQVLLIVAAVLLVQRVLLPRLGIGT
jgi:hypothetical protein